MAKKIIYLSNKPIADFYYKKSDNTIKEATKSFVKNYKRLVEFFGVRPPKISIHFVYTRAEMDKHWGRKSDKRLCAMVDSKSIYVIYIFSPMVFEKLTSYKKSDIIPVIVHEITHTFVSQINKRCFYWTNEGICQFVEKRKFDKPISKKDWNWFKKNNILTNAEISWLTVAKHGGYKISYFLTSYIVKNYGKKVVIELLKIKRDSKDKKLKQKMERILGSDFDDFLVKFEKAIEI